MNFLDIAAYAAASISLINLAIFFIKIGEYKGEIKSIKNSTERNWNKLEEIEETIKQHEHEQRLELKGMFDKMNELLIEVRLAVQAINEIKEKWRP